MCPDCVRRRTATGVMPARSQRGVLRAGRVAGSIRPPRLGFSRPLLGIRGGTHLFPQGKQLLREPQRWDQHPDREKHDAGAPLFMTIFPQDSRASCFGLGSCRTKPTHSVLSCATVRRTSRHIKNKIACVPLKADEHRPSWAGRQMPCHFMDRCRSCAQPLLCWSWKAAACDEPTKS